MSSLRIERTLGLLGRAAEGSHDDEVFNPYKPKLCEKSGLSQVQSTIRFLGAISNRSLMRKLMIRDAVGPTPRLALLIVRNVASGRDLVTRISCSLS